MPIISDPDHKVLRERYQIQAGSVSELETALVELLAEGDYLSALDILDFGISEFPDDTRIILEGADALFHKVTDEVLNTPYPLYQRREFSFSFPDKARILEVGRNEQMLHYTTDFVSFDSESIPRVSRLNYPDNAFDFVYCSDLLEYVIDPIAFCKELQRVAPCGFVQTATRNKRIFLDGYDAARPLWDTRIVSGVLEFSALEPGKDEGLRSKLIADFAENPQNGLEDAFSTVLKLRERLLYLMFYWEKDFPAQISSATPVCNLDKVKIENPEKQGVSALAQPSIKITTLADFKKDLQLKRSCVFLHTYYEGFLANFYATHPELAGASYDDQLSALVGANFGDSDHYSRALAVHGWETHDVIVNCFPLSDAWLRERNGFNRSTPVFLQQLEHLKPDVVYTQDMHFLTPELAQAIKSHTTLLVGQIASSVVSPYPNLCDIVISSLPMLVDFFRHHGIRTYLQPLGFSERLAKTVHRESGKHRSHEISFVGTLGGEKHPERMAFLEAAAAATTGGGLKVWGPDINVAPPGSPLRDAYQGEAWGSQMFDILADSFITLNMLGRVIVPSPFNQDATMEWTNNMRLFEATGCGALLITDYRPNLERYFEVGKEVLAYTSTRECLHLLEYYRKHPELAREIAEAGRMKTLECHTYTHRMADTSEWLNRALDEKVAIQKYNNFDTGNVSHSYNRITEDQIKDEHYHAWKADGVAEQQRALVNEELQSMYTGDVALPYKVLCDVLKGRVHEGSTLLEIGCGSGYYFEILEYLLNIKLAYTGLDISEGMIRLAEELYPRAEFLISEGCNIHFPDNSFEIVVSGGVLLHDPHYRRQIAETCRVSHKYVVAHRTPICKLRNTFVSTKVAYSVETIEYQFNEKELIEEFLKNDTYLIERNEYSTDIAGDNYDVTYVFQRTGR